MAEPATLPRPVAPRSDSRRPGAVETVAALVLVLTLAAGAFTTTASVALLAGGAGEGTEWSLFVAAFAVVLPASAVGGLRLAPPLARRGALVPAAAALASGLLALLIAGRLAYALDGGPSAGTPPFIAGLALWWAGSCAIVLLALRDPPVPALERLLELPPARLLAVPAGLLGALLLGFPPSEALAPGDLAIALLVAGAALAVHLLLSHRRMPRWAMIVVDVAIVGLAFAVVNDLALPTNAQQFLSLTSNLHHNFFLGPANEVLHGRPMLVETFSQYGVGLLYFLAGWFELATPGHGALQLLSGLLTAAMVALGYAILRVAQVARPIAALATAVVALAAFFSPLPPPTSHPSIGGLRFMLPYLLIATTLLVDRRAARARALGYRHRGHSLAWVPPALLGLAALWSVETFGYSLAAFTGMAALLGAAEARDFPAFVRRTAVAIAPGAAAVVIAHILFALLTRILAGDWPDWGFYLAFIGTYSLDGFGTLPVEPWSPGIVLGAAYFASLAGIIVMRVRAPRLFEQERTTLLALAGVVGFGLASFSYFLGRSYPDTAILIGLPAYLAVALWLGALERRRDRVPAAVRVAALATPLLAAGMLAVFSWQTIEERAPRTPLALAIPDGGDVGSLRVNVKRMWRSEPVGTVAAGGAALVRRHVPQGRRALVVAGAENTVDILVQTDHGNVLPVSHYLQDSLLLERTWPPVKRAIDRLRPGRLMITEPAALDPTPQYPAELLQRSAARIKQRFRLRVVDRDAGGFIAVRLEAR